ncbi:MAG: energy-coupling factor transporter ATPase [Coprothermobacterota bacterium]|nr:energy-coupling factor transporter ATPase [Coprothermobacterota bacterium]
MRIEAKHLTYIYGPGLPWEKRALSDVSFSIESGEFIGLIGETGSGKSTLVQILNGLLRPTEGTILLDGSDISNRKVDLHRIRAQVGLVFQFPEQQLFAETVADDVAFGPKNLGVPKEEIGKRVDEALLKVGLRPQSLRDRSPFTLSGGEKRLVSIAGVLAMRPKVLILDEVTAGLDPKGKKEILARIQLLHRVEKATIILVSHDMDEIALLSQRILILKEGKLILEGSPVEIFTRAQDVRSAGLDLPTLPRILSDLRCRGFQLPTAIFEVGEAARWIRKELFRAAD